LGIGRRACAGLSADHVPICVIAEHAANRWLPKQ
jgi:hypothetical protein